MDLNYYKGKLMDAEDKLGQDKIKLRQAESDVFQLTQSIRMQERDIESLLLKVADMIRKK